MPSAPSPSTPDRVAPSASPPRVARQSSPLARLAAVFAALLIVYASFYPFTGWVDTGVPAFAYLWAPWPRWWVGMEIVANLFAYLPLGALLVWAVYPKLRGLPAVLVAMLAGGGLSATIEAIQTFLPTRIASNVDLGANALGTLLGALIAAASARALIDGGAVVQWRVRWFARDARGALLLAGLWVLLQVPRQPMLFGTGDVSVLLGDWLAPAVSLLRGLWIPSPGQRMLVETACTASATLAAGLLLTHRARPLAPRGAGVWALVLAALACKAMLQPLANPSLTPFAWVTAGASAGVLIGGSVAAACAYAPPSWQRGVAIAALLVQLMLVNFVPSEEYFDASITLGRTRWLHLEQLLLGLSVAWPLAALWLLAQSPTRLPR